MDQGQLVESQIEDGKKLAEQLMAGGFDVTAAFWVRPSEEGEWTLYIASKTVDEQGPAPSYQAVYDALRRFGSSSLSISDVKVIGVNSAITREVLTIRQRHPGLLPTRSRISRLGDVVVEEVYIYPSPGEQDPRLDEIKQEFPSAEKLSVPVGHPRQAAAIGPWMQTLAPYMGKINAGAFEGKAPGTVLFLGPAASSGKTYGELVFLYRPEGWNTLLNPKTKRWEEVQFAQSGQPPYESADFGPLAAMKTARKPVDDQIDHMKALLAAGWYMTIPPDPTPIHSIPFAPPATTSAPLHP